MVATQGRILSQEMPKKPLTLDLIVRRGPLPFMRSVFMGAGQPDRQPYSYVRQKPSNVSNIYLKKMTPHYLRKTRVLPKIKQCRKWEIGTNNSIYRKIEPLLG